MSLCHRTASYNARNTSSRAASRIYASKSLWKCYANVSEKCPRHTYRLTAAINSSPSRTVFYGTHLPRRITHLVASTRMQSSIQDKDQWSANAASYAKGAQYLSNAPAEILFTQMNHARPFSTAAAILDVGSGPGVTIGRLIESYGSQFPSGTRL